MNELQVFTNPEFGQVRTVTIEEEPWFVGKDVAVALGYESRQSARRLTRKIKAFPKWKHLQGSSK